MGAFLYPVMLIKIKGPFGPFCVMLDYQSFYHDTINVLVLYHENPS